MNSISRRAQIGMSLIELMIAATIGLLLLTGLVAIFSNASQGQRELQQAAVQIESGRYAMDVLTQDLHHAGFYGQYFIAPSGTTLPDPCDLDQADIQGAMRIPVAIYRASSTSTSAVSSLATCTGKGITALNVKNGSDILVVRRAETTPLSAGQTATANDVYLQANPVTAEIQFSGSGPAALPSPQTKKANGSTAATVTGKDGNGAELRKYRTHIYFVAPCSVPAGGGTVCSSSSDDGGKPIPTLKRLELGAGSGGNPAYSVVPIAEGVDYFKVDLGLDTSPASINSATSSIGDGAPDSYSNSPSAAEHVNAVTAKIYLVTRNPEATSGYADAKVYALGVTGTVGPLSDPYKRHAYAGEVRLVNLSSRREIP